MSMTHWVWLSSLGISIKSQLALLEQFDTPERIFHASESDLRTILRPGEAAAVMSGKTLGTAVSILAKCAEKNVLVLTIRDALYPDRLRNIENPPTVLYVRGSLPVIDDEVAIAVVGTRKAAPRALRAARTLAHDLALGGALVVSGMAEGIDGSAHLGALDAGCRTIAVLGSGIDVCYPSFHQDLMERILENGCIISEYPPGTRPSKTTFPARNRIISGLSLGTLLVSAPMRSGSLITANLTLEQGRDLFIVPGAIDDAAFEGSNELLKECGSPVTDAGDILDLYRYQYQVNPPKSAVQTKAGYLTTLKRLIGLDDNASETVLPKKKAAKSIHKSQKVNKTKSAEQDIKKDTDLSALIDTLDNDADKAIVSTLLSGELQIDLIVEQTGLTTQTVLTRLTMLELSGIVVQKPGKIFELVQRQ